MSGMTADEINAFMAEHFTGGKPLNFQVEKTDGHETHARLPLEKRHTRPGGSVSGPIMMGTADTAAYFSTQAAVGPVLRAYTTSLNINFLRQGFGETLLTVSRILKVGRKLCVVEVDVYADEQAKDRLLASAHVTYSLPASD